MPIFTVQAARMASILSVRALSFSISAQVSVPFSPRLAASMNTTTLPASTMETSKSPYPSAWITSAGFPVGRIFPVVEPAVSPKSSMIRAPVPGTPSNLQSPMTWALPSLTGTSATRMQLVFTWWMRTRVTG